MVNPGPNKSDTGASKSTQSPKTTTFGNELSPSGLNARKVSGPKAKGGKENLSLIDTVQAKNQKGGDDSSDTPTPLVSEILNKPSIMVGNGEGDSSDATAAEVDDIVNGSIDEATITMDQVKEMQKKVVSPPRPSEEPTPHP